MTLKIDGNNTCLVTFANTAKINNNLGQSWATRAAGMYIAGCPDKSTGGFVMINPLSTRGSQRACLRIPMEDLPDVIAALQYVSTGPLGRAAVLVATTKEKPSDRD
jgi:hypothetical protein